MKQFFNRLFYKTKKTQTTQVCGTSLITDEDIENRNNDKQQLIEETGDIIKEVFTQYRQMLLDLQATAIKITENAEDADDHLLMSHVYLTNEKAAFENEKAALESLKKQDHDYHYDPRDRRLRFTCYVDSPAIDVFEFEGSDMRGKYLLLTYDYQNDIITYSHRIVGRFLSYDCVRDEIIKNIKDGMDKYITLMLEQIEYYKKRYKKGL